MMKKYMHLLQQLTALIRMCDLIRLLVYLLVEKVLVSQFIVCVSYSDFPNIGALLYSDFCVNNFYVGGRGD